MQEAATYVRQENHLGGRCPNEKTKVHPQALSMLRPYVPMARMKPVGLWVLIGAFHNDASQLETS
jgi:hypothetical protein